MELAQLRYFMEVARREHFTRAAAALYVSEPSVNRAIARLERELGVPLFDRRGRGVRLNTLGRAFLARVERALGELEEGRREVHDLSDPEHGIVSVGFPHTVGAELLPRLLRAFEDAHPLMRFQLAQTATRPQVLGQLDAGDVDLCISMPFPAHPHTRWVRLLTEEVYLAVPTHHLLAQRETIALREVAAEPFISLKREYAMRLLADDLCRRAGFEPAIAFEGDEFATVRGLVSAGLGVALIPRLGWQAAGDSSPTRLRVTEPVCERELGVAWREDRYLPAAATLFRDFLIAHFAEYAASA